MMLKNKKIFFVFEKLFKIDEHRDILIVDGLIFSCNIAALHVAMSVGWSFPHDYFVTN